MALSKMHVVPLKRFSVLDRAKPELTASQYFLNKLIELNKKRSLANKAVMNAVIGMARLNKHDVTVLAVCLLATPLVKHCTPKFIALLAGQRIFAITTFFELRTYPCIVPSSKLQTRSFPIRRFQRAGYVRN